MFNSRWAIRTAVLGLLSSVALISCLVPSARAQSSTPGQPVTFSIDGASQRLEMIVTTSRLLTLENKIPRLLVNNPEIVRAVPLSPNQIQLSALQTGVTQLNVWDENDRLYTVDVIVYADARELENLIRTEFPDASVRIRPLASSVYLSGYVPSASMVRSIIRMAEEYYPNVINNLTVGGVQQILLKVKVMEVSRSRLRAVGFDWANIVNNDVVVQTVAGTLGAAFAGSPPTAIGTGSETVRFGIVDGANGFFGFIEALRQYNLIKVLAEPTLVTVSGRPASFSSGGEFPILVPQSLGTVSVEYRQFGTRVDFVPIVLGNGNVRLEVRPLVSEIDSARSVTINNVTVPGLRTRWVDTAVEMKVGQTLALAGLIQNRVEAENRGLPWLADLPWFGAAFRSVQEQNNEIELLIMVTPEYVDALDPHEVPTHGPGQMTTSPNDVELYWRGYLEVPRCCPDGTCPHCQQGGFGLPPGSMPEYEPVPADATQPPATVPLPGDMTQRRRSTDIMGYQPAVQRRPVSRSIGGTPARPVGGNPSFSSSRRTPRPPVRSVGTPRPAQKKKTTPGLIGPVGYEEVK